MADRQWTVKDLTEALKRFPEDAKVYYEIGLNGPGTVGKAQYIKAWGGDNARSVVVGPLGSLTGSSTAVSKEPWPISDSHVLIMLPPCQ